MSSSWVINASPLIILARIEQLSLLERCLGNKNTAVLDDLAARRCATVHGVCMIGTLGVIVAAKRSGLISLARPVVEQAVIAGLYLDAQLVQSVLASIAE